MAAGLLGELDRFLDRVLTAVERKRFSPDTLKLLKAEGHTIDDKNSYWGDAECIMIDAKTGERLGGHDERSGYGKAAGY